jgi:hypothetical protein
MIILNVVLKPVGGPTTACTRLGYAKRVNGVKVNGVNSSLLISDIRIC